MKFVSLFTFQYSVEKDSLLKMISRATVQSSSCNTYSNGVVGTTDRTVCYVSLLLQLFRVAYPEYIL